MKVKLSVILLLLSMGLLTGCAGFNYRNACWKSFWNKGMCGMCIRHHCEGICSTCSVNEPQCKACWQCISRDGCMEPPYQCSSYQMGY